MTMSPGFKADPRLWNRRVSLSQRVPVARASKAPLPRQNNTTSFITGKPQPGF